MTGAPATFNVERMAKLLQTLGYHGITNEEEADGLFWLSDNLRALLSSEADRQRMEEKAWKTGFLEGAGWVNTLPRLIVLDMIVASEEMWAARSSSPTTAD